MKKFIKKIYPLIFYYMFHCYWFGIYTHKWKLPYVFFNPFLVGFQCETSQVVLTSVEALSSHKEMHDNDYAQKRYKCNMCSYSSDLLSNLERHFWSHSGTRRFKCDICSRGFTTNQRLKSHMLTHTGQKPYMCKECLMPFRRKDQLKTHIMRRHRTVMKKQ